MDTIEPFEYRAIYFKLANCGGKIFLWEVLRIWVFISLLNARKSLFVIVGVVSLHTIEMKNKAGLNIDEYKTIVFDEIFLYTPSELKRISQIMNQYPEKHFIATGDCDQREPVGFKNSEYLKQSLNILFKDQILLSVIKRLESEEEGALWTRNSC